jgi:hypothetical protein
MTVVEPKKTSLSIFPLSLWERAVVRVIAPLFTSKGTLILTFSQGEKGLKVKAKNINLL